MILGTEQKNPHLTMWTIRPVHLTGTSCAMADPGAEGIRSTGREAFFQAVEAFVDFVEAVGETETYAAVVTEWGARDEGDPGVFEDVGGELHGVGHAESGKRLGYVRENVKRAGRTIATDAGDRA